MKKVLKFLGILVGVLLFILIAIAAWIQFGSQSTYEPQAVAFAQTTDSLTLANGRKIVENVCAYCHRGEDGTLSGNLFSKDEGFGTVYAANITRHQTAGIGRYSDAELATLLRTGLKRDGHYAGPFMMFPNLSQDDLNGIITYLRSDVPSTTPSETVHTNEHSFIAKALYKLGVFKPIAVSKEIKPTPPATDTLAYGKYLALSRYECYACHSADFQTNDIEHPENSVGFMAGGNPIHDRDFQFVVSRNITPHPEQGIGLWTKDQFEMALRSGVRPDGRLLSTAMPRLAALDADEVNAIWAYIQSLPAKETNILKPSE
ncbi:MAG: cytochrome c [Saprospiraceae bacterium]|nr:cytochrome c [Saprospiraceae bacterium]